jgi:gamma-glutamyltranspeptidase/glutathione hydrolase
MLLGEGLRGPFGVVGGFMQAQAHVQLISGLLDDGLDPQPALDRPRFRVDDGFVRLEAGLWDRAGELAAAGYEVMCDDAPNFGAGQLILATEDRLLAGSDARRDGFAAGF